MSLGSQYGGSQAFAHITPSGESVTSGTGSFTFSKSLVRLPGVLKSADLGLTLTFSAGSAGLFGLPKGWSFGLSYLGLAQSSGAFPVAESVTAQGRTYVIDFDWQDDTGYQSGLRYINDHGIKFQMFLDGPYLPGDTGRSYFYTFQYRDGAIDYFDNTGKLIRHADLWENTIDYVYSNPFGDAQTSQLTRITDSYGQEVVLGWGFNQVTITSPDSSQVAVFYTDTGVTYIEDPLGGRTLISSADIFGQRVITGITYPTGLKTWITYQRLYYRDSEGQQGQLAAVQRLRHEDADGSFLDETGYAYGIESGGNTFTGYNGGYRLYSDRDSLMDDYSAYVYDVFLQRSDDQGKPVAARRTFYDHLHNPTREITYDVSVDGTLTPRLLTEYTYFVELDQHARSPNYNKPVETKDSVYAADGKTTSLLRRVEAAYNDYGSQTSSKTYRRDPGTETEVLCQAEEHAYAAERWGGAMLKKSTYKDQVGGSESVMEFALTDDEKSVANVAVSYRSSDQSALSPWKEQAFEYDDRGRKTKTVITWAPGNPEQAGTLTRVETRTEFAYASAEQELTVTEIDGEGNAARKTYKTSIVGGPLVARANALGEAETFSYDSLGRLTGYRDAEGQESELTYTLQSDGDANAVLLQAYGGYRLEQRYDGLGRGITVSDNGDPTSNSDAVSRTLRRSQYNALGLISADTNELALTTRYSYDGLGRLNAIEDALGNRAEIAYDDVALTATTSLNGDRRSVSVRNGLDQVIRQQVFPDSTDTNADGFLQIDFETDGFGRLIAEDRSQIRLPDQKETPISRTERTYNAENGLIRSLFKGLLAPTAERDTRTQFDLLNNPVESTVTTTYEGNRVYTAKSETSIYNSVGLRTVLRNHLTPSQDETYRYDAAGRLVERRRYDGTAFTYGYDTNGNQTEMAWDGGRIASAYLPNGRVSSISNGGEALRFAYSRDGSLTSVVYPDSAQQHYHLDGASRVVGVTDPSGRTLTTAFDDLGRIATRGLDGDTLTYSYATVNHAKGLLTGLALSGGTTRSWSYDFTGFGQVARTVVTDGSGKTVLESGNRYDANGRLTELTLDSAVSSDPAVNGRIRYGYDALDQVISESVTDKAGNTLRTLAYTYDGAANVLSVNDDQKLHRVSYNAFNQQKSDGMAYDTNGRVTADGTGWTYAYNALDQLVEAKHAPSRRILYYRYDPDGALAQVSETDGTATRFYYRAGATQAAKSSVAGSGDVRWTSFLDSGGQRLAACGQDSEPALYSRAQTSSALISQGGTETAIGYQPYGGTEPATTTPAAIPAALPAEQSFLWTQAFQPPGTDHVYLRARWYRADRMVFLSPDPVVQLNRYAYCSGDPINLLDPTGEMSAAGASAVGTTVALTITIVLSAIASAVFPPSLGASVAAGAAIGATAAVAGDATATKLQGQKYTWQSAMVDVFAGAISGATRGGLKYGQTVFETVTSMNMGTVWPKSGPRKFAINQVWSAPSSAVNSGVKWIGDQIVAASADLDAETAATGNRSAARFVPRGLMDDASDQDQGQDSQGFLPSGAFTGKLLVRVAPLRLTDAERDAFRLSLMPGFTAGARDGRLPLGSRGLAGQAEVAAALFALGDGEGGSASGGSALPSAGSGGGDASAYATKAAPDSAGAVAEAMGPVLQTLGGGLPSLKAVAAVGAVSSAQTLANVAGRGLFAAYPEINRFTYTRSFG